MNPEIGGDPRIINAQPTKDLFITMLTKDIPLVRSIIDLVDNCVDGARRLRNSGDFNNLWVRLELSQDSFRISDNCGGISIDIARQYAFRFGRPDGMQNTVHSVGQFGVGMKRALFKLGTFFSITSKTATTSFVLDVNVEEWKKTDLWEFRFTDLNENQNFNSDEQGTTIQVRTLHPNVSREFTLENFRTQLINELQSAQLQNLDRGLAITVNGIPLQVQPLQLLHSQELKPVYYDEAYDNSEVKTKIYAGIGESNPIKTGWYIFCNGRQILGADQTYITGWGEGGGKTIPKYHNQFARFYGFVFFDSDDAALLPWNTTKTGVDADSQLFKYVRQRMITIMRPIITFLNKLDAEKDVDAADPKPLETLVQKSTTLRISEINATNSVKAFSVPKITSKKPPAQGRIQYDKPLEQIKLLKKKLGVSSNREVGEKTFEYFLIREGDDNAS